MKVFVVDKNLKPCDPVNSAVARILLREKKATVYKRFPFVIKLKVISNIEPQGLQLKIDPGSKVTGLAIVNQGTGEIIFGAELEHRGWLVKKRLKTRHLARRFRRYQKIRFRQQRYLNKTKPKGWLPPSLMSRIYNIETWTNRLKSYSFIVGISLEYCKFDMQKMMNSNITQREYKRGELFGFEVREYLLQKYNWTCIYCGAKGVPLQVEHVIPKSKGGTNRVSNLVIACEKCNRKKGSYTIEYFLRDNINLLNNIKAGCKLSLTDASAINSTKVELLRKLQRTELPVELSTGVVTSYNRHKQGLTKTHWIDAACVGNNTPVLTNIELNPLIIKACGHGNRRMSMFDKYGFPKRFYSREKMRYGFQTGDIVKINIIKGKNLGQHMGRVTVNKRPYFDLPSARGFAIKGMILLQKADGYSYSFRKAA